MRKTNEALEEYRQRYPQLVGLKTDEEFRELAISSVIQFLEENRASGVSYLGDIYNGTQEHYNYLVSQVCLDFPNASPGDLELLETVRDMHHEQLTTIATLKALSDLYEDKQRYSPEAAKAFQEEVAEDSRYQTAHAYDE